MKEAFVPEASVAVGWVHPAQATGETEAMLRSIGEGATVEAPALWALEVANALTVLVRRRKLAEADRVVALRWLQALHVRVDYEGAGLAFTRLSELAIRYRLSIYDAAYLELAQRRGLVLGCKDGPLRDAARRAGVNLWA